MTTYTKSLFYDLVAFLKNWAPFKKSSIKTDIPIKKGNKPAKGR
jgi:hypothetical protein